MLCTVNPEWPECNPNSYPRIGITRPDSWRSLLKQSGFHVRTCSARFRRTPASWRAALRGRAQTCGGGVASDSGDHGREAPPQTAVLLAPLVPFPAAVVDGMAAYAQPVPLESDQPVRWLQSPVRGWPLSLTFAVPSPLVDSPCSESALRYLLGLDSAIGDGVCS
jgi:hypothetical protein